MPPDRAAGGNPVPAAFIASAPLHAAQYAPWRERQRTGAAMVQSMRVEVQWVNGDVEVRARFASVEEALGVLDHLLRRRDGA